MLIAVHVQVEVELVVRRFLSEFSGREEECNSLKSCRKPKSHSLPLSEPGLKVSPHQLLSSDR